MKPELKDKIIIVLAIFAMVLFIYSLRSCGRSLKQKGVVNQARLQSIELEQRVADLSSINSQLESKINQLQNNLKEQQGNHQAMQQALNKAISELRIELERITLLNQKLEQDLEETAISSGGKR